MGDEHINPELLKRLGRNMPGEPSAKQLHDQIYGPPEARYQRELDTHVPIGGKGNEDKLAFFWIGYFVLFLIVAPILINLL